MTNQDKFIFNPAIPSAVLPEIQKHLFTYAWLIPGWCQRIFIEWSSESDGLGAMCSNSQYEYRQVTLTFYPCWHTRTEPEKQQMVIHELLHSFSDPLYDYSLEIIKSLLPESESPTFRENALRELTKHNESFIQDLSYCILNNN